MAVPESKPLDGAPLLQVMVYFFILNFALWLGTGITAIPLSYYLKEGLQLNVQATSMVRFCLDSPLFIGFVFGFLRDRWRPFRMEDRGYFLLVPPFMSAALLSIALGHPSLHRLVFGMIVSTCGNVLLSASIGGLLASVAKRYSMTGRLSVVYTLSMLTPPILSYAFGGFLVERFGFQGAFLLPAVIIMVIPALSFWKPRPIFQKEANIVAVSPENIGQSLRRLFQSRVVFLPAGILILFSFMPGWNSPLFYYLSDTVKLSPSALGLSQSFTCVGNVLFIFLYGVICQKFAFGLFGVFLSNYMAP